jgi:hypothetical protein
MSPRVGVIVALIAAALLATSLATSAWWSGHPTFDGKQFDRKTANIGLITANQCNYTDGEESDCKHLSVGGSFAITKWVQLGFTGILALSLLLLAITRKRGLAKLVMIAAAGSAVMAVVLLVTGPNLKTGKSEAMPLGYGFFLFFGGTALGILSGVLSLIPPKRPSMKLRQLPSQMQAQQPPAGFDVHALLAEGDAVRPAQLGPEPQLHGRPQSPGGMLPGPAGPLVPPSGPQSQPLFNSAPQLRPLYEATGGGYPPSPTPVQFPSRGPTPMPHAAVSAALGLDPPLSPPIPQTVLPVPPIVAPAAPKLPPPNRTKAMSAAPPLPSLAKRPPPPATRPPPPLGSATKMSAAVPPPPMLPMRAQTEDPADLLQTHDYEKATGDSTSPNVPFDSATAENETKAFQNEERTDVGDELETKAREKIDHTDPEVEEAPPRVSATSVELASRVSSTAVELDPKPRASTSVISSAAPPPRHTPMPVRTPTAEPKVPMSTAADDLPPPAEASPASGPSPACPQCEAPMAWVEEHLRFYCKSCRMYF